MPVSKTKTQLLLVLDTAQAAVLPKRDKDQYLANFLSRSVIEDGEDSKPLSTCTDFIVKIHGGFLGETSKTVDFLFIIQVGGATPTTLAGARLQPLGHLSSAEYGV